MDMLNRSNTGPAPRIKANHVQVTLSFPCAVELRADASEEGREARVSWRGNVASLSGRFREELTSRDGAIHR